MGQSQSVGNMMKTLLFTCLVAAAKADADADAAYLAYGYGLPYAYAGVPFGSSSGLDPITQGLDPVTQGALPAYTGYAGYLGHYLGKRSADADADAAYLAYGYGLPYAYTGVPFGSSTGLDPITQGLDPVTQGAALPAYTGYTGYYGHFLGKRSADADADAFYAAYPYTAPVAYAGVPFGSSTGLDPITQGLDASTQGYAPFYGYSGYYGHYLGKRSADAEADADAFYAAYPYAAPVTYAYAGVPFGSSTGLDPITQGLDAATQGYAPYFGYTAGYYAGK